MSVGDVRERLLCGVEISLWVLVPIGARLREGSHLGLTLRVPGKSEQTRRLDLCLANALTTDDLILDKT